MSGRRIGAALAIGVVAALIFDLLLLYALAAVSVVPRRASWQSALEAKSYWLVVVVLASAVAPWLNSAARVTLPWPDAFRMAGTVLLAAPLLSAAAVLMLFATSSIAVGEWATLRSFLLQSPFYSQLFTNNGPWLLAGAALRATARHVPGEDA